MNIVIPQYFINNKNYSLLNIDNLVFVKYLVHKNNSKVGTYLTTNLLIIVLKGKKVIRTSHEEIVVHPGKIAFLKERCHIVNEIIDLENGTFESLMFFLDHKLIMDFYQKNLHLLSNRSSPIKTLSNNICEIELTTFLKTSIESIFPFFVYPNSQSNSILKIKFYELLLNIIGADKTSFFIDSLLQTIIEKKFDIINLMENSFTEPLKIEEFARLANRSLSSFKNDFKKAFGTSPIKWICNKRLEKAYFLLTNTNYNISDVCYLVGFNNPSYFGQIFKKKYGYNPIQLKNRYSVYNNKFK